MAKITSALSHATIKKEMSWECCSRGLDMSERAINCTASGVPLVETGSTSFPCPGCDTFFVGRSPRCRNQGVIYNCSECDYQGP